jgi:5-hydroxyisourate hydrolase-like protein (transthyretin family)
MPTAAPTPPCRPPPRPAPGTSSCAYTGEHFKEPTALSEEVLVRFSIFDAAQHYHVPMLCSPWFFNTYRGS